MLTWKNVEASKASVLYIYIDNNNNNNCKDQIWLPNPKGGWTQAQKAQYNEFVESELENWDLMNQTITNVDSDDKKIKVDWFDLKKKNRPRHSPRRSVFIYFSQV